MPVTPDKLDVILSVVLEIRDKIGNAVLPPTGAETNEFLDKWKPVTDAEFLAKYGVARAIGNRIPPMTSYDEAEAIYRARAFYSTQGYTTRRFTTPDVAINAVTVIGNATQETATQFYECGGGKALSCFPDTLAYCWYVGLCDTQTEYQQSLGAGTQPAAFSGVTLEHLLAPNFSGGSPSGGG